MNTVTNKNEQFLDNLDYKKKAMYKMLPEEKKDIIKNLPSDKHRKRMIALFSYDQRNTTPRQKWINGLHHMREMTKDAGYFFKVIFKLDKEAVDDIIDIYLNFEAGEYDSEKQTDPSVYSLLAEGVRRFKARRYHEMDYDGLLDYFEANPHKNPLNKENNKASTMSLDASKPQVTEEVFVEGEVKMSDPSSLMLNRMGQHLKERRLAKNITQSQLAHSCQISERTVKKIEAGEPSSTKTLLKLFDYFDISAQVLEATKPSLNVTPSTKQRVRFRKKP